MKYFRQSETKQNEYSENNTIRSKAMKELSNTHTIDVAQLEAMAAVLRQQSNG